MAVLVGEPRQLRRSAASGWARSTVRSVPLEVILLEFRVQRGERLLPDERDAGVDQRERAEDDQQRRERAQRAAPRRGAARPAPRRAGDLVV